MIRKLWEDK